MKNITSIQFGPDQSGKMNANWLRVRFCFTAKGEKVAAHLWIAMENWIKLGLANNISLIFLSRLLPLSKYILTLISELKANWHGCVCVCVCVHDSWNLTLKMIKPVRRKQPPFIEHQAVSKTKWRLAPCSFLTKTKNKIKGGTPTFCRAHDGDAVNDSWVCDRDSIWNFNDMHTNTPPNRSHVSISHIYIGANSEESNKVWAWGCSLKHHFAKKHERLSSGLTL